MLFAAQSAVIFGIYGLIRRNKCKVVAIDMILTQSCIFGQLISSNAIQTKYNCVQWGFGPFIPAAISLAPTN
jgi:hypothetical protein